MVKKTSKTKQNKKWSKQFLASTIMAIPERVCVLFKIYGRFNPGAMMYRLRPMVYVLCSVVYAMLYGLWSMVYCTGTSITILQYCVHLHKLLGTAQYFCYFLFLFFIFYFLFFTSSNQVSFFPPNFQFSPNQIDKNSLYNWIWPRMSFTIG